MWSGRVFVILIVCAWGHADDDSFRIVKTAQGSVKGYRGPEGDYFAFYNIPYATAPTGKHRFKAPLPGPVWITTLEAVDRDIVCPQAELAFMKLNKTMQEDCLIANVFVPDTEEKNLPVVFQVHGGAYQMGFGNMMMPSRFVASKKVIVVNFNYRLGIHGFLCLGTPDVPGNAGMKDQVAALRWVHKNIAKFGGNPNDITIQGYSAGSSAVDLLLLSKLTKGLFTKAIPESGANVGTWSVQIDPLANAKEYAAQQNFNDVDDFYALEEFYKSATYEMLTKDTFINRKDNDFVFTPCVERYTGGERFLEDNPVNILKKREYSKVPMLYGFANMEGLFRVQFGYDFYKNVMNENFSEVLPRDLQFENDEEKKRVANKVKEFYFGDKQIGGDDTIFEYIDYFTDIVFAYSHLRSLKLQVEAGNNQIYLYEYAYPDEQRVPAEIAKKVMGANHCAQSMALLDGRGIPGEKTETSSIPEDLKKMKKLIRDVWHSFITTGSPVAEGSSLPAWPPAGANRGPYMELSLAPQLKGSLLEERARFWDEIYESYYRAPVPPPEPPVRHIEL